MSCRHLLAARDLFYLETPPPLCKFKIHDSQLGKLNIVMKAQVGEIVEKFILFYAPTLFYTRHVGERKKSNHYKPNTIIRGQDFDKFFFVCSRTLCMAQLLNKRMIGGLSFERRRNTFLKQKEESYQLNSTNRFGQYGRTVLNTKNR
jgi:hypothetical protein